MIKHGPISKTYGRTPLSGHSHLKPIKKFITKGVADATESIVFNPLACDIKGAKKYNPQQCVIAKTLTRTMHPQAVAVGRSMAFVVIDGLAIRFEVPFRSRSAIEEFDTRGRIRRAPIELRKIAVSQRLSSRKDLTDTRTATNNPDPNKPKLRRMRKIGVRAVGGGVSK